MIRKYAVCIMVLFLFVNLNFSVDRNLVLVMTDDTKLFLPYPEDTQTIVIFDSDSNKRHTKSIQGLNQFPHLKILEFQSLAHLDSYDFLAEVTSCEELYINTGPFFDLSILRNIKNLKKLEFRGYMTQAQLEKLRRDGLDVSPLASLEEFIFSPLGTTIDIRITISHPSAGLLIQLP